MMLKTSDCRLLIIYGPTATGKTDLALQLAKKYSGEIISADSRQVYRGLDIGTGKVSFDSKFERHEGFWIVDDIKIRGFDLVSPGEQFTAADFLKFASNTMVRITETSKLPIVVGGTGFYIKALTSGIGTMGIPASPKLRRNLEKLTITGLYQKLLEINPKRAQSMNESDRANPRRLIRAIEIARASSSTPGVELRLRHTPGVIPSVRNGKLKMEDGNYLFLGLTAPNAYLYDRADLWLSTRIEKGMIEEVKHLLNQKIDPRWLDNLGLEYRWLTRYLLGKISKEEAIDRLKGDIHSFIRRQKTWFKKLKGIQLFDIGQPSWQGKLEKTVKDWYHTDSSGAGTTAKN